MIVFNGGLTINQVDRLKNYDYTLYRKVPWNKIWIPGANTFDYVPKELYGNRVSEINKYVSNDVFKKQYMFLARHLVTALDFCRNWENKNYIMVCDIPEEILNDYIGVGDYYDDCRIEYRLPRCFITPDTIIDFLYFEVYNEEQISKFREKYDEYLDIKIDDDDKARELMLEKNLKFNRDKKIY